MIERMGSNRYLKVLALQLVLCALIFGACATVQNLIIVPCAIGIFLIFFSKRDEIAICFLLFFHIFAGLLKVGNISVSVFFVMKIVFLGRYLIKTPLKNTQGFAFAFGLALFILYCTFNSLFFETSSVSRIVNFLLWFLCIYAMCVSNNLDFEFILKSFLFSFLLSCLVAASSNYVPGLSKVINSSADYVDNIYGEISRYKGIFNDPNITTIVVMLCCFICNTFMNIRGKRFFFWLIILVFLSFLGISTGSKSCLLLLIAFWVYYLFQKKGNRYLKLAILALGLALIAAIFATPLFSYYEYRFFGAESGITTGRDVIWGTYVQMLNEKGFSAWLFGLGINTKDFPNDRAAHQTILQVIYNAGILGLIAYVFLVYETGRSCFPKTRTRKLSEDRVFVAMPFLFLIAESFFLDLFFIENAYFCFAVCIMLAKYNQRELSFRSIEFSPGLKRS